MDELMKCPIKAIPSAYQEKKWKGTKARVLTVALQLVLHTNSQVSIKYDRNPTLKITISNN